MYLYLCVVQKKYVFALSSPFQNQLNWGTISDLNYSEKNRKLSIRFIVYYTSCYINSIVEFYTDLSNVNFIKLT